MLKNVKIQIPNTVEYIKSEADKYCYCIYYMIKNEIVIYIGRTSDLKSRLCQHAVRDYDRILIEAFDDNFDLHNAELKAIAKYKPILNTNRGGKEKTLKVKMSKVPIQVFLDRDLIMKNGGVEECIKIFKSALDKTEKSNAA